MILVAIEHSILMTFFFFTFPGKIISPTLRQLLPKNDDENFLAFLLCPWVNAPILPHLAVNTSSSTWEIMLVFFQIRWLNYAMEWEFVTLLIVVVLVNILEISEHLKIQVPQFDE